MRLFGLIATGFWLTMMTLLVKRDVLPAFGRRGDPDYRRLLSGIQDMRETRMGIYVAEQKLGCAHEVIRPNPDGGYHISSDTELDARFLGEKSLVTFRSNTHIDGGFKLAFFDLSAVVLGVEASVRGSVIGDELVIRTEGIGAEGRVEEKRIKLDGPMTLSTGLSPFTGMPDLSVGKEWTIVTVDPVSAMRGEISTQRSRARVEKTEVVEWEGEQIEAFVVNVKMRSAFAPECTAWITRDGRILRQRVGVMEWRLER